jgi:protein transport protein SEC13
MTVKSSSGRRRLVKAHHLAGAKSKNTAYIRLLVSQNSDVEGFRAYEYLVNSISWAPHELGAMVACASSDGKVSVLTFSS